MSGWLALLFLAFGSGVAYVMRNAALRETAAAVALVWVAVAVVAVAIPH